MIFDALHLTFPAKDSNVEPWLGEGWHHAEEGHRWTDGLVSVVRLPAFKPQPWFVLTLQCLPYNPSGVVQTATLNLNGADIAHCRPKHLTSHAFAIPGDLVRMHGENVLTLLHPNAATPALRPQSNGDTRVLALGFHALDFQPLDAPLHPAPRLLPQVAPPTDPDEAKALMEKVQSLGFNCSLGLAQRHYKAEPHGLLRFASLHPEHLARGLKARFAGVGDLEQLKFRTLGTGGELQGRHDAYLLDYHTFRQAGETDIEAFAQSESKRLAYLARMLIEQMENNEKIFVRYRGYPTNAEALALHVLLRAYHRDARLLIVDEPLAHAPERAGRVIELGPGLYRGYLLNEVEPDVNAIPPPNEFLRLFATVAAHEGGRAV